MNEHLKLPEQEKLLEHGEANKNLEAVKRVEIEPSEPLPDAHEVRKNVEAAKQQAVQAEDIKSALEAADAKEVAPAQLPSHDLKKLMLGRNLHKIQRQLPAGKRILSKVVHQPVIDRLSEASSKTVARPSGILSGSLFALLGSIVYLYIAKHYGYHYNYLLFLTLFVIGFFVGLIIELVLSFIHRSHKKS